MSGAYNAGRFEWLTIPEPTAPNVVGDDGVRVHQGTACPRCGWIDSKNRFEATSEKIGVRQCPRCLARWDLTAEINQFFENESIDIPPVTVDQDLSGFKWVTKNVADNSKLFDLYLKSERFCLRRGFDELLCLGVSNIDYFEHQTRTALTALKKMKGRCLLADQVGLGKTIEAGLIVKELLLRGLASSVLVLVPAGLTGQWKSELEQKFGERFPIFSGHKITQGENRLIVTYDIAKRRPCLLERTWDVLVLDEAHRLKSTTTILSKYVRALKSRFLLALSATPVQNTLRELYALVDLVEPGKLGTFRSFSRSYINRSNPRMVLPGREAALRQELDDIMIRNNRDACDIAFSKRRAGIYFIEPTVEEIELYNKVTQYIRKEFKKEFFAQTDKQVHMLSLCILQREIMSTPAAAKKSLLKISQRPGYPAATCNRLKGYAEKADAIKTPSKINALIEILNQFSGNRFIVFTEFINSQKAIVDHLMELDIPIFAISGKTNLKQRSKRIDTFLETPSSVLISTETGGVGLNLQHGCHHLVNFDLPWNPMKVEQRIGRIDRIGQKCDVYIFNLVCKGFIEEHVVNILGKKLKMFSLVIGECETILGHMNSGRSFDKMIQDVWKKSMTLQAERQGFKQLANDVERAAQAYESGFNLDHAIGVGA